MAETFECHIMKTYTGSGDPNYHGELCLTCGFWKDTSADVAFKIKAGLIKKEEDIKEVLEWF